MILHYTNQVYVSSRQREQSFPGGDLWRGIVPPDDVPLQESFEAQA
jgi:hypothetical protein